LAAGRVKKTREGKAVTRLFSRIGGAKGAEKPLRRTIEAIRNVSIRKVGVWGDREKDRGVELGGGQKGPRKMCPTTKESRSEKKKIRGT